MLSAEMLRKLFAVGAIGMFGLGTVACNTSEGIGRDTQEIGEEIEDAAEDTGDAVEDALD